ncbi:Uncharacterized protein with Armadillo-like helical [Cryptosporidium parvum]|nr:Uncharacterized protein with Armadillo-like helical [Cryptosporidium parvum]|eukprot:QOY41814.1 hypothetical protein CPATCC_002415 [Cryptosporidium parvum]
MTQDKRTRISAEIEDSEGESSNHKKINIENEQEISEIVQLLKKHIRNFEMEKVYYIFEKINQREIFFKDIEDYLNVNFSKVINECLLGLNIILLPDHDQVIINGLKIKILKLILNILLDISEFQDESSQIGENSNINSIKLKLLLENDLRLSLLKSIKSIEHIYLQTLKADNISKKEDQNFEELISHESELLQESVLETYFQLLESTIEIDPENVSKEFTEFEELFDWLIQILDDEESSIVDEITSLKMEILSIIFQYIKLSQESTIWKKTNKKQFMDKFLVKLANLALRDTEIGGIKEKEFLHNIIDIICNLLFEEEMRKEFCDLQGLELMIKLMKEKTSMRHLSIKVVSFAMLDKGEMNNKFIQMSGLKLIFGFLAHSSKNLINDESYIKNRQQQDTDEHLCSIVKSLLQFSTGNDHKILISKLIEDNYSKLKNFLILRNYYSKKITQALENSQDDLLEEDENQIEIIETLAIDAGLFIVQLIDLILVYTIYYEKGNIHDFEKNVLSKNGIELNDLKTSIEDYSSSLNQDEKSFNERMLAYLNL